MMVYSKTRGGRIEACAVMPLLVAIHGYEYVFAPCSNSRLPAVEKGQLGNRARRRLGLAIGTRIGKTCGVCV